MAVLRARANNQFKIVWAGPRPQEFFKRTTNISKPVQSRALYGEHQQRQIS